jgi:cyanophycinase-like exopeptidase
VGSGEYLRVMDPIDAALLKGRPARWVQLATAAVPDGPQRLEYWHDLGRVAAARHGVEVVILDVRTADDANDLAHVAALQGAGLIYLSGGHPDFLASVLRGSLLATAITDAWHHGAALAGCSAGAMVMGSTVPRIRSRDGDVVEGLGLLGGWRIIPHFDAFIAHRPELVEQFKSADHTLLGIDEDTAFVWGLHGLDAWQTMGRGVTTIINTETTVVPAGTTWIAPKD